MRFVLRQRNMSKAVPTTPRATTAANRFKEASDALLKAPARRRTRKVLPVSLMPTALDFDTEPHDSELLRRRRRRLLNAPSPRRRLARTMLPSNYVPRRLNFADVEVVSAVSN